MTMYGRPGVTAPAARPLRELLAQTPGAPAVPDVHVTGVAWDSRRLAPGNVFVAIRGSHRDGHEFIRDAVRQGAGAVVVEEEPSEDVAVPVVRVPDSPRALAGIAAAWYGHPDRRLRLIGITGTIGKTSVLKALDAILHTAGIPFGAIGSLGVSVGGEEEGETGYTAPDALTLHRSLARIAHAGCKLAAMEVTSHALDQQRVHGLRFELGVFTNLVPLEHADYHTSFARYVRVKRRFFDHVSAGAPVIYFAGDRAVRRLVHAQDVAPIGCGVNRTAAVRIEDVDMDADGTTFTLHVRRPIPRLAGDDFDPIRLPLRTRLLGRSSVVNLSLAAAAALAAGAPADAVSRTLWSLTAPRRRVQIIHRAEFIVIDDTVGHPDAVSAIFEVITRMRAHRVHVAFAVRGSRGSRINRRLGESLAIWASNHPLATLVITTSLDAADERNRVQPRERSAFLEPLRRAAVPHQEIDRVSDAVHAVLDAAQPGDLVLLLGAQGMDTAAAHAYAWLDAHQLL